MSPIGQYKAVKHGWSWPAFFFSLFWAAAKRLWCSRLLVLIAFFLLLPAFSKKADISIIMESLIVVFFGLYGNK